MKAVIILILSVPAMLSITAPWLNENVNDVSKLEGDMVTENDQNEESTDQCQHGQHAGVLTRSTKLWNNQTIPYMISKWFKARHKAIILSAIAEIEDKTCVTFVERTTHINHVFNRMGANGACSSEVGRVGKRQYVNLTEACATHSTVLHELAHVLGFYHEHNRYDRDEYIQIIFENVVPKRRKQYEIINQTETLFVEYKIPYDYRSITHYPEYSNSANGKKTILSKKPFGIIPESAGLSHYDVIKINLLYSCEDLIPDKENIVQKEGDHQDVENSIEHAEETIRSVSNIETTTVIQQRRNEDDTSSTSHRTTIQQLPLIQSTIKQVQTTSSTTITEISIGTTSKMTTSTTTRPISISNKEIIKAVEEGNETTVRTLLNEGADVNARKIESYESTTLLHIASEKGHENVVSLLLAHGANVNDKDKPLDTDKWTPLHCAAKWGHVNVVSLLLDKGANIEAKNINNWTPLHYAAQDRHMNVISLLLDKGANIEARRTFDMTPFHYAAQLGHVNVVSLLLDKGANIEARTISNQTPLHEAAEWGHVNVVSLLLDTGANIEAKDTYSWTPLHYAARYDRVNVVTLLLDKGANILAKGQRWFGFGSESTPLDLAEGAIAEILKRKQRELTG